MSDFVVFEGIDGSGKTTQLGLLADKLDGCGRRVIKTAEPTDGPIGKLLRSVLQRRADVSPMSVAPLFTADRMDHAASVRLWLGSGKTVLCDRYLLSSLAYQSEEYPLPWLYELNRPALELLTPALTFFIDAEPSTAMSRITSRGEPKELFEATERLQKTREAYLRAIEYASGRGMRVEVIDGERDCGEVAAEIEKTAREYGVFG